MRRSEIVQASLQTLTKCIEVIQAFVFRVVFVVECTRRFVACLPLGAWGLMRFGILKF